MISLRRVKGGIQEYNDHQMSGSTVAIKDAFCSNEVIRKTPYLTRNQWRISFECGSGCQWDNTPMSFSCYA